LLLAIMYDRAPAAVREKLEAAWKSGNLSPACVAEIRHAAAMLGVEEQAKELKEKYRKKTFDALKKVKNINLKILLYRITAKILGTE